MSALLQLSRASWGGPYSCSAVPSEIVQENKNLVEAICGRLNSLSARDSSIDVDATLLQIRQFKSVDISDSLLGDLIKRHHSLWGRVE